MPVTADDFLKTAPQAEQKVTADDFLKGTTQGTPWQDTDKNKILTHDMGEPTKYQAPLIPKMDNGQTDWKQVDPKTIVFPADRQNKTLLQGEIQYDFLRDVTDTAKSWQEHLGIGQRQMSNAIRGAQYLFGVANPADFRPGETQVPAPADYHNDFIAKHFNNLLGPAVEAIPQIGAVIGGGAATGVAGAGIGAVGGLLGGPLAEVTVPGGAAAGFGAGFNTGAFSTAAGLSAGEMYGQLREAGITDEKARPGSIAFGVAAGLLQTAGLRFAGQSGKIALEKWMAGAGAQQAIKRMLVNAGVNTTAGTIQGLTDQVIKTYEGVANGKASLVTKDWGKAFTDALVQSAKVGIPLAGVTEGGGALLGTVAKDFTARRKPTVGDAADVVHAAAHSTVPDLHATAIDKAQGKVNDAFAKYDLLLSEWKKEHGSEAEQHSISLNKLAHDVPGIAKARKALDAEKKNLRVLKDRTTKPTIKDDFEPLYSKTHAIEQKAQWDKYYAEIDAQDKRTALVKAATQVTRVLPGAINEIAKRAKQAEKEGRELTADEKISLTRDLLPTNAAAAKNRFDNMVGNYIRSNLPGSRVYGYQSGSQSGKLLIAFQDAPNPEPLARQFDTYTAEQEAGRRQRLYDDMRQEAVMKETGLDQTGLEDLIHKAKNTELTGTYINRKYFTEFARGEKAQGEFNLTADQVISYLMWRKNPEARPGLMHGNEFTLVEDFPSNPEADTTEKVMREALRNADPKFEQALKGLENWYVRVIEPLQGKVKEQSGEDLPALEGYGGRISRKGEPEDAIPQDLIPRLPWQSHAELPEGVPGFVRKRTDNLREILPKGAFENAAERSMRQGQWEAMVEPAKLWQQLSTNPDFIHANTVKYGRDFMRSIETGYRDIIHGSSTLAAANNKWIDGILRARFVQQLGAKPIQAVKHLTTIFNGALYRHDGDIIPPQEYVAGLTNFFENPEKAINEISEWDAIKHRYANPAHTVMGAIVKQETKSLLVARAEKVSTLPFVIGDKGAAYPLGWSIYQHVLNKTGDVELAKTEAGRAINETLASSMLGQLSDMARSQIGKLFVQFQQPAMRLAQHRVEAWRRAVNFPTRENIGNALYVDTVTRASMALFVLPGIAFTYALTGDEKQREESVHRFAQEFRLGAFYPISRDGLSMLDTTFSNLVYDKKHRVMTPTVAPFDMLDKLFHRLPQDIAKHTVGGQPLTGKAIFEMAIEAVQGTGAPIPLTPVTGARTILTDEQSPLYVGRYLTPPPESKRKDNDE